jgi:hypothetical protein
MARRFTTAAGVVLLAGVCAGPAAAQPKEGQPRGEAARRLAEEVELIEAQLDTRKAHVRAAEVAVEAAARAYNLLAQAGRAVDAVTLEKAKTALELAKAQADIRKAEMKEVEVKLKHAKRRLEEAPAAEREARLMRLRDLFIAADNRIVDAQAAEKAARAKADQAKAELDRAKRLLDTRVIPQAEYEAIASRAASADADLKAVGNKVKVLELEAKVIRNELNNLMKETPEKR